MFSTLSGIMNNITLTPNTAMNKLTYRTPFYLIICRSYKLLNMVLGPVFSPTLYTRTATLTCTRVCFLSDTLNSLNVLLVVVACRISYCHLPFQSKWLYVGTERGNVHVVSLESFTLSGYVINWNKAIEL